MADFLARGVLADVTAPLQGEGNADRMARDLGAMAVEVPRVETMSMQIPELAHVVKGVKNAGRAVKDRLAQPGRSRQWGLILVIKERQLENLLTHPASQPYEGHPTPFLRNLLCEVRLEVLRRQWEASVIPKGTTQRAAAGLIESYGLRFEGYFKDTLRRRPDRKHPSQSISRWRVLPLIRNRNASF
ncbi:hypothetical protein SuNHUV7_00050 (plasmid) [Pseudoseohaeicola sp. NH-UV-7]